jgi:hypothetical protein
MAFARTYSKLQENAASHKGDEEDLEGNESDTTKFSSTVEIYDKMHFLPLRENLSPLTSPLAQRRAAKRSNKLNNFWTWLRFSVIVGLQIILILLLSVNQKENKNWVELSDLAIVSHTYTFLKPEEEKYIPNMTTNDNRMEVRKNWDLLMPRKISTRKSSHVKRTCSQFI